MFEFEQIPVYVEKLTEKVVNRDYVLTILTSINDVKYRLVVTLPQITPKTHR
jgi:hypothetical protein